MKFTGERMIPDNNKNDNIYFEHMSRYIFANQFVKEKIVLDIACGVGYGSSHLLSKGAKKVIGVDISQEAIDYAKKQYQNEKIEFLQGDATNIPLENDTIDVIVSFETIEHLKNQEKFLREVKRVLKNNGLFIISSPNSLVAPKGNTHHFKEFTPTEFRNIICGYFNNLKVFYQDNVFSNYIFDEESLNQNNNKNISLENFSPSVIAKDKNLFLICLASDSNLPQATGLISLYSDRGNELKLTKIVMQRVYNSSSWKLFASFLHKLRKTIPIRK